MTNLTEYSWYYCKMKNGDTEMLERGVDYFLSGDVPLLNNEVESVLAEVPSYDVWQAKLEENTKLKELLKECRDEIKYLRKYYKGYIDHFKNNTRLDKEINQVLGEE